MNKQGINVGLMGLGVIGSGVAGVLTQKSDKLAQEAGIPIFLRRVLEKDISRHGMYGLKREIFTTELDDIIDDPSIDIVIELIGGEEPAFDFIKKAICSGKHVVTANKEVLAKHGYELFALADKHNVELRFEASVGGGIPIISPLMHDFAANDIQAIHGIVNGTTNYILTRMGQEGIDFSAALKHAQKLGYAEADPGNDVEGKDAAYKLAILATLAFGTEVRVEDVYYEGISKLKACDFRYASELGYAIKLLAIARLIDNSIETRVHPVLISRDALLAKVDGVYNAIDIEGDLVGKIILYGQGAGSSPTSSAVVADVIKIAQDMRRGIVSLPKFSAGNRYQIRPMPEIETRFYIRISILDQYGVLAQISRVLGDNFISIASVIQKETDLSNKTAEIVIMTHPAKEAAVQKALRELKNLKVVKEVSNIIRVKD
ncbi:MAG TPA: homoserine dehydrogenase [Dehalococcoidia bacterium]|nr:homoserine dehydrogenase [Dehalococcoidia bacterium]